MIDQGKKMFDRLNPNIAHTPKVVGPVQEPVAWMVYTQEGQSVYVTDNPTDIQEGQRALPLYTTPPKQEPRNFCPRCGKRTPDLETIHTCTPPQEKNTNPVSFFPQLYKLFLRKG